MSDEIGTEDFIDGLQDDMNDADINDFLSFDDAENNNAHGDVIDKEEEPAEEPENFEEKPKPSEEDGEEPEAKGDEGKKSEEDGDEPSAKEIKKLLAKFGDEEIEIAADAIFKQKVDGEEVEVSLQDLLNNDSGKKAVAQRFSELDKAKKEHDHEKNGYERERDALLTKVDSFADAVKGQDAEKVLRSLAELTGTNPIQLRKDFKNLMLNQVRSYDALSPEAQKDFDMDQERKYYQEDRDYQQSQNDLRESSDNLEKSVMQMMTRHGISDKALVELYDEAEAKSIELNSAEDIERYYQSKLTQDKSSSILSQVDPSLLEDENNIQVVSDFIQENPDLSDAEVLDLIKEVMEESEDEEEEESSISKKVQAKGKKNKQGKSSKSKKNESFEDNDDELLNFDDVMY